MTPNESWGPFLLNLNDFFVPLRYKNKAIRSYENQSKL